MIHIKCPRCQAKLSATDDKAGEKHPCIKCGQRLLIPQPPLPPINKTILAPLADPDAGLPPGVIMADPVEDDPIVLVDGQLSPSLLPRRRDDSDSWFVRLRLSGYLLAIGSAAGLIAAFLPLVSVSMQGINIPGFGTEIVVGTWQGKVGLGGYIATMTLAFVLYPPNGLRTKAICWAAVAAGLLVVIMSLWVIGIALQAASQVRAVGGLGFGGLTLIVREGGYINVIAGIAVVAGSFIKTREEELI